MTERKETLLRIKNLKTHFFTDEGIVKAVDGVDLEIPPKETLGIVGESGCGKTVTALSIMRLLPAYGKIVDGSIFLKRRDLTKLQEKHFQEIRGKEISMVFQEPMSSLNPIFTIGQQIEEAIIFHQGKTRKEAREIAIRMLKDVEFPQPAESINKYPHQLSGGMQQRAMIAIALSCEPELLIADEPTTALDVTIQKEIIELLHKLKEEHSMSILFITHDLGVISQIADKVAVMYASKIIEHAEAKEIFNNPKHPYTIGLLNAIPQIGKNEGRLQTIPGQLPNPLSHIEGCRFHPRCFFAIEKCIRNEPPLEDIASGHKTACWRQKIVNKNSWIEYSKRYKNGRT
ncbi:MAG: ABC transporter ATP-binding protein [Candidatus Ratteibacteria bacterium]|nr:ABC transporter ATP-binding protein [Candidatus Ratteibacteria bacterium]